jgi:integrase
LLYKVHRRVGELAGLHSNRVHDLRHSYATIEIYEHHASMQYVSEQLEYAGITITVGTYGHRRPGSNIALADRLDAPGTQARDNAT